MSNKFTLKLMPLAEQDLDGIYNYITNELKNPQAFIKLIQAIEEKLIGLEDMPMRCSLSGIPELRLKGYRKCVINNYVALYKLDEKQQLVIVARVFYGMRDYKNLDLF